MRKLIQVLKTKAYKQTMLTLLLRGFGVLFLFAISFLMTNNFSPSTVGEYEFIRVFLLVTGSICLIGTDISIIYFAGKLKALKSYSAIKNVYFSIVKIIGILSIVILLVFFIFFDEEHINRFFNDDFYEIVLKSLICLFFYAMTLFNTETLRALDKTLLSELFRNIFKYIPLSVGILFQILFQDLLSISEYYVYGFVFLFVFSQIAILYNFQFISGSELGAVLKPKEIVKTSLPMGFSNMVMFLLLSVDLFLLKRHFGNDYVAFYAIAIKLMTVLSIIILSFNINVSPQIAELYSLEKFGNLQRVLKDLAKKIFLINLLLAVVMILFIEPILKAFGPEYLVIKNTFYILVLSQLYTSFFGVVPVYLNMTGRAKMYQTILLVSLLLNIILNSILIPFYGTIGAAITFTTTVVFWNSWVMLYVYKKDKIKLSFI